MNATNNQAEPTKSSFGKFFGLQFHNFGEKFSRSLIRFPLTFVSIAAISVMIIINIHAKDNPVDLKWIVSGVFSAFLTLAFYLFAEDRLSKVTANVINLILMGLAIWLCSTYPTVFPDAYAIQAAMLVTSFALALFFAVHIFENSSLSWWNNLQETIYQAIISAFFAGVLMVGLSLAILSLNKLFDIKIQDNVYEYLAVCCFILFMPTYFMSQLSDKSHSTSPITTNYPTLFKVLGLYILFPILSIYTLILYGYLFKIIATWTLPNGWVSWLVSILGFAALATIIILHPLYLKGENKTVIYFTQFFPIILIPLLILMLVGIVRRFSDYGVTINRLLILILNLWFFAMCIYLFISHSRQPKWILISFSVIALLAAIGPWSVINVTKNKLKSEFSELLQEAHWTNSAGDKIITLEKKKQERIYATGSYLQKYYGIESIRPMFSSLGQKANINDLTKALGIKNLPSSENNFISINNLETSFDFDVSGYKKAIWLSEQHNTEAIYKTDQLNISLENETLKIIREGNTTEISLLPVMKKVESSKQTFQNSQDATIEQGDYKLIIIHLNGRIYLDGSFGLNNFGGWLLIK
ncbi:MAG: DUF4153 domain-containing protein [Dysgonamonadaceae bacterium]|jgi:hypothetical protein|nr:DUF4153 domain-containing protein [Dysgonamonadaceae bacterium]